MKKYLTLKISFFIFVASILFYAGVVKAQCNPACTGGAVCQVETDTGNYSCVSGGGGGGGGSVGVGTTFPNPLKYDKVESFLTEGVLSALQKIIVVLSIIFIIIGAIFYITSAGDEKRMTTAKGAIFASMIGLAIGVAAPSFLKEIYNIMGARENSGVDTSRLVGPTLTEIALKFLNFLLSIVGTLGIIMLVVGGIMYLTSAGDDDRIKTAKKVVTFAIIGIAVSLAALVIVRQIANLLTDGGGVS
jgi:hypothetical protein